jgi:hypothetical protein
MGGIASATPPMKIPAFDCGAKAVSSRRPDDEPRRRRKHVHLRASRCKFKLASPLAPLGEEGPGVRGFQDRTKNSLRDEVYVNSNGAKTRRSSLEVGRGGSQNEGDGKPTGQS